MSLKTSGHQLLRLSAISLHALFVANAFGIKHQWIRPGGSIAKSSVHAVDSAVEAHLLIANRPARGPPRGVIQQDLEIQGRAAGHTFRRPDAVPVCRPNRCALVYAAPGDRESADACDSPAGAATSTRCACSQASAHRVRRSRHLAFLPSNHDADGVWKLSQIGMRQHNQHRNWRDQRIN